MSADLLFLLAAFVVAHLGIGYAWECVLDATTGEFARRRPWQLRLTLWTFLPLLGPVVLGLWFLTRR